MAHTALAVGDLVELSGMTKSRFNGKRGVVVATERPSGLWPVVVDLECVGKDVDVSPSNCINAKT